jgi:rubrerythrin
MAKDGYAEFMAKAYTMELEAVERYALFAEQLDSHNNREVAALFRKLSHIETLHAKKILDEMGWPSLPPMPLPYAWEGGEASETAPQDEIHYLMQPWHALQLALECEKRAAKFYESIAAGKAPKKVKAAATEMADEEHEHVRLIEAWIAKVPPPDPNWDRDLDPPRMSE